MITSMPEEERLAMPVQCLKSNFQNKNYLKVSARTLTARVLLVVITLLLTMAGTEKMYIFLHPYLNRIQFIIFFILYFLNLCWISFFAASAIEGFFFNHLIGKWPEKPFEESRTALIMPLYNENTARSIAAMEAMTTELYKINAGNHFEIVILSDSTDKTVISTEKQLYAVLKNKIKRFVPVWYRHRADNVGRKAGNIADFVRRWGNRYDYMIVLDADSLLSTDTILTMVKRMQGDNTLGILQTVPSLYGHRNLFARLQQFASRIYGGINAAGIAAWTGNEGNYWGHNAIIRVKAFAQSCGLPKLHGRKPFGGYILSHDFVEAALIRRAGWKVKIATDLHGSWEESPPSLLDQAARDRRWMQGNLQHLKVLKTAGVPFCNRVHFIIGILGYVSSVMWLAMIITGLIIVLPVMYLHHPQEIISVIRSAGSGSEVHHMLKLFVYTMSVLFLPKILGYINTLFQPVLCKKIGGWIAVTVGVIFEIIFSVLFAPIQMLFNTKSILEIITGQDSGWKPQRRTVRKISTADAWKAHGLQFFVGLLTSILLLLFLPEYFICFLPVLAGLLCSVPLSIISSSVVVGYFFEKCHLFLIPEETTNCVLISTRDRMENTLSRCAHAFASDIKSTTSFFTDFPICSVYEIF